MIEAHCKPLPKGNLWLKYEPCSAEGRENMLRTIDLGRTDGRKENTNGRTDGWTVHYRAGHKTTHCHLKDLFKFDIKKKINI